MNELVIALPDATPFQVLTAHSLVWIWFLEYLEGEGVGDLGPGAFGFEEFETWHSVGCMEEVSQSVYQYSIVGRLSGLKAATANNRQITPLVQENVKDFIRDRFIRFHLLKPGKPSSEEVLVVIGFLKSWMLRELRKRSLFLQSPGVLGFDGYPSWKDPECCQCAAITCYSYAIEERRELLKAVAAGKSPIIPLIRRNIGFHIMLLQRANDPLGYRIYQAVNKGILVQKERRFLEVVGDGRSRNVRFLPAGSSVGYAIFPDLRTFLFGHEGWPAARWDFSGRPKKATHFIVRLLGDMPGAGILAFWLDDFLGVLREGLSTWIEPPPHGEGRAGGEVRFWDMFEREKVMELVSRAPTVNSRGTLERMLDYLENFPWGEELVYSDMANALGMARQALNYHLKNLRGILESCRKT